MSAFLTYKKFFDPQQLKDIIDLLEKHKIPYQTDVDNTEMNVYIGSAPTNREFYVKLHKEDFDKVNALIEQETRKILERIPKDHYLYDFTDEELLDLISKKDTWSELDYQLALKILKDRGKEVSEEKISDLKKRRITDLSEEESGTKYIVSGYIVLFVSIFLYYINVFVPILFSFFPIITGFLLMTTKKTLPNGTTILTFDQKTRVNAKILLVAGFV